MVLVDTSVWVTHLRTGQPELVALLHEAQVLCHPFVIGELACGNLKNRAEILSLLQDLPSTPVVSQEECLHFIDVHRLMGKGIGFVDAHLLASCRLVRVSLWTEDRKLKAVADGLDLSYG